MLCVLCVLSYNVLFTKLVSFNTLRIPLHVFVVKSLLLHFLYIVLVFLPTVCYILLLIAFRITLTLSVGVCHTQ